MIEAINEDNNLFNMSCMKEPNYVIKIMASWMTLNELEGAETKRDFINRSGTKEKNQFKNRQPSGIHFRYRHQVDYRNNRRHASI